MIREGWPRTAAPVTAHGQHTGFSFFTRGLRPGRRSITYHTADPCCPAARDAGPPKLQPRHHSRAMLPGGACDDAVAAHHAVPGQVSGGRGGGGLDPTHLTLPAVLMATLQLKTLACDIHHAAEDPRMQHTAYTTLHKTLACNILHTPGCR